MKFYFFLQIQRILQLYFLFIPKGNLNFFYITQTYKSNFLRKATNECFHIMFFVWKCFIGSRDNDQIRGFLHTPWVKVPWCWEGCDTPNQLIPRHSTYEPAALPSLAFYPAGFTPPSRRAKIISITHHIDHVTHVFKLACILPSNQIWSPGMLGPPGWLFLPISSSPWVSLLPSNLKWYNDLWYLDLSVLFLCPLHSHLNGLDFYLLL